MGPAFKRANYLQLKLNFSISSAFVLYTERCLIVCLVARRGIGEMVICYYPNYWLLKATIFLVMLDSPNETYWAYLFYKTASNLLVLYFNLKRNVWEGMSWLQQYFYFCQFPPSALDSFLMLFLQRVIFLLMNKLWGALWVAAKWGSWESPILLMENPSIRANPASEKEFCGG